MFNVLPISSVSLSGLSALAVQTSSFKATLGVSCSTFSSPPPSSIIGAVIGVIPTEMFLNSALLRSAVERQLEIIGEALNAASKEDESLAESVPDLTRIVGLRNRLIHGYDSVDAEIIGAMRSRASVCS